MRRLGQIEEIVRREHIVTLPNRNEAIRLATEAESAAGPAPHLDPPRLVSNTGEAAEFVLPLGNPNATAGAEMDDFNYDAVAWTLTAHEARPGHEFPNPWPHSSDSGRGHFDDRLRQNRAAQTLSGALLVVVLCFVQSDQRATQITTFRDIAHR